MRIIDWSSDVCSSDLSVGIDGFFQMISGPAGGVMVIAFGILTLRLRQKRPAPVLPRSPGKPLGILLLIVLGIAILGPAAIEAFSYVHLLLAQNTGRYKTIEGPITKYVPATPDRKSTRLNSSH